MLPNDALYRIALRGSDHESNTYELIGIRAGEVELKEVFGIDEFGDVQGSPIDYGITAGLTRIGSWLRPIVKRSSSKSSEPPPG